MANVTYTCRRCGNTEDPMNHGNPESGWCRGTFEWEGNRVRCNRCNQSYSTSERFYCTRCEAWHTDYRVT